MAKPVKKAAAAAKKSAKPAGKTKPAVKPPVKKAAAKPIKPVAKATKPVAKTTKPVAKTTKPAAQAAKPVVKKPGVVSKLVQAVIGVGKKAVAQASGKAVPAKANKPPAKPLAKVAVHVVKPVAAKPEVAKATASKPMPTSTPVPDVRPAAARSGLVAKAYAVAKAVVAEPLLKSGKKPVALAPARKQEPIAVRVDLPKGYKPSHKEPYMNANQQEFFRQMLSNWRHELVEESKQTIDNLRDEVRDVGDEAERATRETENSLELRTRDRYRKLISKIDDALRRIDEGAYGYCVDTGDEIGLDRLAARPTAERTVDAQERWEHRQKQMGD